MEELQKPCWAGSGSEVFGVFPSQLRRAEPLSVFRTIQAFVCETIRGEVCAL